jgi:hypothetical protein
MLALVRVVGDFRPEWTIGASEPSVTQRRHTGNNPLHKKIVFALFLSGSLTHDSIRSDDPDPYRSLHAACAPSDGPPTIPTRPLAKRASVFPRRLANSPRSLSGVHGGNNSNGNNDRDLADPGIGPGPAVELLGLLWPVGHGNLGSVSAKLRVSEPTAA